MGPNGAGKTTLLRIMLGIYKPTNGKVFFCGKPLDKKEVTKRVGYVPQKTFYRNTFPLTVVEAIRLGLFGKEAVEEEIEEIAEIMGVKGLFDRKISELSGGEFQRIIICSALSRKPDILILDEPNTGLDSIGQEGFYETIKELKEKRNITVIMVSHDIGAITTYVDEIACLNRKLYYHGKPDENFEKGLIGAYGEGMDVIVHSEPCQEGMLERRGMG